MRIADQFRRLTDELGDGWADARFELRVADESQCERAASFLGPLNPGRARSVIRFYTARHGAGHAPDVVRRLLRRLDAEGIAGELSLVSSGEAERVAETSRATFAASWNAAVAGLPPDWSDVYAEVELSSTDYLDRAALVMSPLNPSRFSGRPGFRFRVARDFGYGAAASMAQRCIERLDENGIRGEVRILRVLSDTDPVSTQGPVWHVGGKSV